GERAQSYGTRFAARNPGSGGNLGRRDLDFGNGEAARFGRNRKTAYHPGACFNGWKHYCRGHPVGNQPPHLTSQIKRDGCPRPECARASPRRKETRKVNHARGTPISFRRSSTCLRPVSVFHGDRDRHKELSTK